MALRSSGTAVTVVESRGIVALPNLFFLADIWITYLSFDLETSPVFILCCNCIMFLHHSGRQIFIILQVMVYLGIPYLDFISA